MYQLTITFIASFVLVVCGQTLFPLVSFAQFSDDPYGQAARNLEQRQATERARSEDFQRAYNTPPSGFANDATRQQATEQNYYRQQREDAQQWRRESPQFDPRALDSHRPK